MGRRGSLRIGRMIVNAEVEEVNGVHVDTALIQLLRSLKPYMGDRSLRCAEALEAMSDLVQHDKSRIVREKVRALRSQKSEHQINGYPVLQEVESDAEQSGQPEA